MPTIWHIPDNLWEEFKLVLPPEKPARTVGRPAVPFRKVLNGILYVLRTGCQWKKVSKEFGSGSTCHARFQEWIGIGVFKKVWKRLLEIYDEIYGTELKSMGWATGNPWISAYRMAFPLLLLIGEKRPEQKTQRIEAS